MSRVEKKKRKHESLVVENEGMLICYLVIFWLHSTQNKTVRSCFFSWVWRSWKCSLVQHHVLVKNSCFGNWWSLVHSWSHSVLTILWDLQQSRSKLIAAAGPCCLRYPCTVLNWQRSALSRFWLMFCFVFQPDPQFFLVSNQISKFRLMLFVSTAAKYYFVCIKENLGYFYSVRCTL